MRKLLTQRLTSENDILQQKPEWALDKKGLISGHIQYVKSLTADCDYDTILCKSFPDWCSLPHRNPELFFFFCNEIVKKKVKNTAGKKKKIRRRCWGCLQYYFRPHGNPKKVHTNLIGKKRSDNILKKVGEENTEIIIAAKTLTTSI